LRAQLEPHFLFNTLNSISSLMYTDVDAADRMMTRLAQLLRSAIDRKGEQEVALRDELALVAGYVEIEKIRFEERLDVQFDISSVALEARVPSLILQPLMENAIRHGLGDRPEGGRLRVSAAINGEALHLRIADDGVGVASTEERVGIGNTRARLQALYGDGASLRLHALPSGGSVAEVVMPYRRSA
jgi:LytS/YehU family sensor histidine kinase